MPKYIEVEELENLVQHEIDDCKEELATANYELTKRLIYAMDGANRVVTIAKNMPSADVVKVKHGEWERIESDTGVDFRCSVCHRYRFHNGEMLRKYKFCPNCGADMRGETE